MPTLWFLLALLWFAGPLPQQPAGAGILSPRPGQALQGKIPIVGNTAVPGFRSAEIRFGYAHDPSGTWFAIAAVSQAVDNGRLVEWDTTQISDGSYSLQFVVTYSDGRVEETRITDLSVRNYTPGQVSPELAEAVAAAEGTSKRPLPPRLAPNPAELSPRQVGLSVAAGALVILGLFGLAGLYLKTRG